MLALLSSEVTPLPKHAMPLWDGCCGTPSAWHMLTWHPAHCDAGARARGTQSGQSLRSGVGPTRGLLRVEECLLSRVFFQNQTCQRGLCRYCTGPRIPGLGPPVISCRRLPELLVGPRGNTPTPGGGRRTGVVLDGGGGGVVWRGGDDHGLKGLFSPWSNAWIRFGSGLDIRSCGSTPSPIHTAIIVCLPVVLLSECH